MDMNKAYFSNKQVHKPKWKVIDAKNQVVGRLATKVADILRGKHAATFTPHSDAGDYVVVINAESIKFTGNKMKQKIYEKYTGYIGNKKFLSAEQIMAKDPARIVELAVKGMLPKTKLARQAIRKLRVYSGSEHPHEAQITK